MESDKIKLLVKIPITQASFEVEFSNKIGLNQLKRKCCEKLGQVLEINLLYKQKLLKTDEDVTFLKNGDVLIMTYERKNPNDYNLPEDVQKRIRRERLNEKKGMLSQLTNFNMRDCNIEPEKIDILSKTFADPAKREFVLSSLREALTNPQSRQHLFQTNPSLRKLSKEHPEIFDLLDDPNSVQIITEYIINLTANSSAVPLSKSESSFPPSGFGQSNGGGLEPRTQAQINLSVPLWANLIENPLAPPKKYANYQKSRQIYARQLQIMRNMGYINDPINANILEETRGNIKAAVEKLNKMLDN